VLVAAIAAASGLAQQTNPKQADPASVMRGHYSQVLVMHDAVIRGDLAAIAAPASELVKRLSVPSSPAGPQATIDEMRFAAKWAADTTNIAVAAAATATLLKGCGDCHRFGGVMPSAQLPDEPKVGGVVGTMLDHQRAVEQMLQGLIGPSTSMWRDGAKAFAAAPLHPLDLPAITTERQRMVKVEKELQRRIAKAADLEDSSARASAYADILAQCSGCHVTHAKIWGPVK
jgi:hypothetical protein